MLESILTFEPYVSVYWFRYSTDGSEDSGVLTTPADSATSEPSPQSQQQVTNSIKYLRI